MPNTARPFPDNNDVTIDVDMGYFNTRSTSALDRHYAAFINETAPWEPSMYEGAWYRGHLALPIEHFHYPTSFYAEMPRSVRRALHKARLGYQQTGALRGFRTSMDRASRESLVRQLNDVLPKGFVATIQPCWLPQYQEFGQRLFVVSTRTLTVYMVGQHRYWGSPGLHYISGRWSWT